MTEDEARALVPEDDGAFDEMIVAILTCDDIDLEVTP